MIRFHSIAKKGMYVGLIKKEKTDKSRMKVVILTFSKSSVFENYEDN